MIQLLPQEPSYSSYFEHIKIDDAFDTTRADVIQRLNRTQFVCRGIYNVALV
jgi:hypothetical protein